MLRRSAVCGLAFLLASASTVTPHPGGLDSQGCHTCRTSCEQWGLDYGEYHCHNSGGGDGGGGSDSGSESKSDDGVSTGQIVGYTALTVGTLGLLWWIAEQRREGRNIDYRDYGLRGECDEDGRAHSILDHLVDMTVLNFDPIGMKAQVALTFEF